MNYENAIEINNLNKTYDGFALKDLSFRVPKGSIMGFVGQNGAGKSTTIKTILNIVKKDSGTVRVFGLDHVEQELEIKKNLAVVFDEVPFHDALNGKQVNCILKDIYENWNQETFYNYLDRFQLPTRKAIGQFSKGMKMKFQIATALSHDAQLLIMDEPTSGLDPVVRSEMLDVFMEYIQAENHTILLSSHITSDLERIADSITFIHGGRLLLTDYKDDILYRHGIIRCEPGDVAKFPEEDIVSVRRTDYTVSVMVKNKNDSIYQNYTLDTPSLDEILLYYVRGIDRREWEA
ncbi:MAG: ABC transporter ATP-binding protein [Lachnospiraceae bacterium]|nr:ABC transporter ATP-binding protein [Lachnospiraceae bacterium]